MVKLPKFGAEDEISDLRDEDTETLAAIDEGTKDAEAGRSVPAEDVRKHLPKWITTSFTRKGH